MQKDRNTLQKSIRKGKAKLSKTNAPVQQEIKKHQQAREALQENAIKLQALIDASTDLILLVALDGTVVAANESACERCRKALHEFRGLNVFSLLPPHLKELGKKMGDTVIRTKQPACCLEEIEGIFYRCVVYPIFDDKGGVKDYSVFIQDVTPDKLAEKRLINREKNFRALAENANDAIILINMDDNIVYANKSFAKISGYTASRPRKGGINDLIGTTGIDKIRETLRGRPGENPDPERCEINLRTKSGETVPMEATLSMTMWQGQLVSMMILRNITTQKQTEAKLISEQLKLEHRVKIHMQQLVETNNAVCVLARNIDQKSEEEQKQIAHKIKSKILPIIEGFEKNEDFAEHRTELAALKLHLKQLISQQTNELGAIYTLTTTELRVAIMIKNGLNSSEIARQLYVSLDTVKSHRRNIRRKFVISNSKINLASYLRARIR